MQPKHHPPPDIAGQQRHDADQSDEAPVEIGVEHQRDGEKSEGRCRKGQNRHRSRRVGERAGRTGTDQAKQGPEQDRRQDGDGQQQEARGMPPVDVAGLAVPATAEMEAERGKALGKVPVEHRGLETDREEGGQPRMRRQQKRAQFRAKQEGQGKTEADENAGVFGECREAQQDRRAVEPPEGPGFTGLVADGEQRKAVNGGKAQQHQQMIVIGDQREAEEQRRGEIERCRRPEPGPRIGRCDALRPVPEDGEYAGEGQPHQRADAENARQDGGDGADQPGVERRMVEIRPAQVLAPQEIIGFVAEQVGGQMVVEPQRQQQRDDDLERRKAFGHGRQSSPRNSRHL